MGEIYEGNATPMTWARRGWRTPIRLTALVGAVCAFSACSSTTGPSVARDARILIEGSAPNPLRLIISTDFVEVFDEVNQAFVVGFNAADTTAVELPVDQMLTVPEPGDLLVRLTQLDTSPASVRMRVLINGRPQYDQSATLADEGTLEFRFFSNR